MNADHTQPTPDQARQQLLGVQATSLRSTGDRKFHAIAIAVLGLTMGLYLAAQNITGGSGRIVLSCVFVAICLAAGIWVERTTRTVPRRAKRWSRLGLSASLVLALVLAVPWLNLRAQTQPNTWPMILAAAVLIAVPSLLAATLIARGRR